MAFVRALCAGWVWRLAWRDSRRQRQRLILFTGAIAIGVGALVAIRSFQHNLRQAISLQARELLGADLALGGRTAFPPEVLAIASGSQAEQAWETSFASMITFMKDGGGRLVQVRAIDGGFPFYGQLETDPPDAAARYRAANQALVDDALMRQYGAEVGDAIRIGQVELTIAGRLLRVPGEMPVLSEMAPRVFIPRDAVAATGLLQRGSRVFHRLYLHSPDTAEVARLQAALEPYGGRGGQWRLHTVESRQQRVGRQMRNVNHFLDLFGLAALLLGALGVGSAIHVYMRQKTITAATLRCLGATPTQTLAVYLVQTLGLGLLGAGVGIALGLGVQHYLPVVLAGLVPARFAPTVSWPAVGLGLAAGVGFTVVFALLPLLRLRAVSPLLALRGDALGGAAAGRDWLWLSTWGAIVVGVFGFASATLGSVKLGAACTGGLLLLFGLLSGSAVLLMRLVRGAGLRRWPFVWRQGMCNLYRPHNQTAVLMLALGLGAFLLATLLLIQAVLLGQLRDARHTDGPNLVVFDVQQDQAPAVADLLARHQLPLVQSVPLVNMRLASINGRGVAELRQQQEPRYERWTLNREYRSSYRDHLVPGEQVTAGAFVPSATLGDEPVPITVEVDLAESLHLKLGDTVEFDVHGLRVATRIAGLREVDWYRLQTNFFFVFPTGVLEDAPQTWVQLTRAPDAATQAAFQREALELFPNVSVIDISLIVSTLDALFDRLAFAIRFMSLFSLLTGAIVLLGSVSTSRYQRLRENVLLRTLGGSGRQIVAIAAIEFLLLGTFAALAGAGLAIGASWALTTFWFEISWSLAWGPLVALWAGLCAITVGLGMANSLGVLRRPPLEILRQESA